MCAVQMINTLYKCGLLGVQSKEEPEVGVRLDDTRVAIFGATLIEI